MLLKSFFLLCFAVAFILLKTLQAQTIQIRGKDHRFDWIQTARVFLMDAYQPPFVPVLEYNADDLVKTMVDMNANVVRIGTMGRYAMIQGTRYTRHPSLDNRDILQETIDACKPKGIKIIPYISTGHKLAWSMVTKDYPEYGQKTTPNGEPARSHMYVGEDHGTVCWMTPYRQAYMEYVTHVIRDYDIDGIYFDAWIPFDFWPGKQLCYCDGCLNGFRKATGLELPYHENDADYTQEELKTIDMYHAWYKEEFIANVVEKVSEIVRKYKDIPQICNIVNPVYMASVDYRIVNRMDAFLYERGHSILERAQGASTSRSIGMYILPYIGTYHNWPRLAFQGINYQQEIFTNLMFGGGSIVAQPTGYLYEAGHRQYVRYPYEIIKNNEVLLRGTENYPYVGVLFGYASPKEHVQESWIHGTTDARTCSLGAFAACLYNHIQVSSISEFVLDTPDLLKKYPVIYLANVPYLSPERVKNIINYVKNGGCLVVSYETGLFDKDGHRQVQFDLQDLCKVKPFIPEGELAETVKSYTTMVGGPNDLYLSVSEEGGKFLDKGGENQLFPLFYYESVKVLDGGKVLMNIVTGADKKAILPGVVMSEFGKGRVLYCASALESLYNSEGPDVVGELIRKFIETVAPEPAPYLLNAPASLISNLVTKENTLIFHLTNWTGNKFEHPWKNEYYLAPVENAHVKIRIPENKKVKKVYTLVNSDFQKRITGQVLEVTFPRIDAYQALVVELE